MLGEVKDTPNILIHVEISNADKQTGVQYMSMQECALREIAIDNVNLKTNGWSKVIL